MTTSEVAAPTAMSISRMLVVRVPLTPAIIPATMNGTVIVLAAKICV